MGLDRLDMLQRFGQTGAVHGHLRCGMASQGPLGRLSVFPLARLGLRRTKARAAPSNSALLSPRPYRDVSVHVIGFMTIYQVALTIPLPDRMIYWTKAAFTTTERKNAGGQYSGPRYELSGSADFQDTSLCHCRRSTGPDGNVQRRSYSI